MPKMSKPFNAGAVLMRSLIPDGVYPATITATDIRIEGADGTEETLVVQMVIFDGADENGRTEFEWFRVNSTSKPVREIAEKKLAQMLDAVGIEELSDTEDLHGKTLRVRVSTQTSTDYPPRNRFAYLPAEDMAAAA